MTQLAASKKISTAHLYDAHHFSLPHFEIAHLGLSPYSFVFFNTYAFKGEIKETGVSDVHLKVYHIDQVFLNWYYDVFCGGYCSTLREF